MPESLQLSSSNIDATGAASSRTTSASNSGSSGCTGIDADLLSMDALLGLAPSVYPTALTATLESQEDENGGDDVENRAHIAPSRVSSSLVASGRAHAVTGKAIAARRGELSYSGKDGVGNSVDINDAKPGKRRIPLGSADEATTGRVNKKATRAVIGVTPLSIHSTLPPSSNAKTATATAAATVVGKNGVRVDEDDAAAANNSDEEEFYEDVDDGDDELRDRLGRHDSMFDEDEDMY